MAILQMHPRKELDERWLAEAGRPVPRYTSYPTAHSLTPDLTDREYRSWLSQVDGDVAMYAHFPFCEERCTYCACNMIATRHRDAAARYLQLFDNEAHLVASALAPGARLTRLHWGGGTPTYYAPEQLRSAMRSIRDRFAFAEGAEISIEADPRVTTFEQLRVLRELGFDRLSVGVQDFDPAVQAAIGRIQSAAITRQVMQDARQLGFHSVNVDLVYGLPLQSERRMRATMKAVVEMLPDRIAIYGYAHLPERVPHQRKIAAATVPGVNLRWKLERVARNALVDAGYVEIGLDHFARPQDPLAEAARHGTVHRDFMGYTPRRSPTQIGLGVSSIGEFPQGLAQNVKKLSAYEAALGRGELPVEKACRTDAEDAVCGEVIQRLMCDLRLDVAAVERTLGIDFEAYFARELDALRAPGGPIDLGILDETGVGFSVDPAARTLVRNVCRVFDRRADRLAASVRMSSAV